MRQAVTFSCKSCSKSITSTTITLTGWSRSHGRSILRFCSWRCFVAWVQPRC